MEDITVSWNEDTGRWTVELSHDDLIIVNVALVVTSNMGTTADPTAQRCADLSDRLETAIGTVSK